MWEGDRQTYNIVVQPDPYGKVFVSARHAGSEIQMGFAANDSSPTVAQDLGMFFNNLSLDLDGPLMTFNSMMVRQGRDSEVIDMKLNLKLIRMPPLDITF